MEHHLPWILVHGERVWPAALALLAGGAALLAWAAPRLAARRSAARARDGLGPAATALDPARDGDAVTLRGTLAARPPLCRAFDDHAELACVTADAAPASRGWTPASRRAEGLSLVVGDVHVELEGDVEVRAGAREHWTGAALPAHLAFPTEGALRAGAGATGAGVYRALRAGDVVRARGVLKRRVVAEDAAMYRGARVRWSLAPLAREGGAKGAVALAFEGAPGMGGGAVGRAARGAVAGLVAFVAVFVLGGAVAELVARRLDVVPLDRPGLPAPEPDVVLDAAAFAAATPFHREAALRHLERGLGIRRAYDGALVAQRAALASLRGDHRRATSVLLEHGALAEAAASALAHRDGLAAATAWYGLGRFDRASDALARVPAAPDDLWGIVFEARVHLLAARLDRAAGAASRASGRALGLAAGTPDQVAQVTARRHAQGFACVAHALRARRGDGAAPELLRRSTTGPAGGACAVLLADLTTHRERPQVLGPVLAADRAATQQSVAALAVLLGAQAGVWPRAGDAGGDAFATGRDAAALVAAPQRLLAGSAPALERSVAVAAYGGAATTDDAVWLRARLAARLAVFESAAGDHDAARMWLARAAADLADASAARRYLGDVAEARAALDDRRVAIELRAGRPEEARRALTPAPALWGIRRASEAALLEGFVSFAGTRMAYELRGRVGEREAEGWDAAHRGDCEELAGMLSDRRFSDESAPFLWLGRASPGGTCATARGRALLGAWVRWGAVERRWDAPPIERMALTIHRALAAEATGDFGLARDLRAAAQRFRAALLRPDTAVALAVLE